MQVKALTAVGTTLCHPPAVIGRTPKLDGTSLPVFKRGKPALVTCATLRSLCVTGTRG